MQVKRLGIVLAATGTLALGGCAATGGSSAMKTLDASGVAKVFKRGSKACSWMQGATKGQDFYYTTASKTAGDADRNIGNKTIPGAWAVQGDQLCLSFGARRCYRLHKVDKKTLKLIDGNGNVAMSMKC